MLRLPVPWQVSHSSPFSSMPVPSQSGQSPSSSSRAITCLMTISLASLTFLLLSLVLPFFATRRAFLAVIILTPLYCLSAAMLGARSENRENQFYIHSIARCVAAQNPQRDYRTHPQPK